MENYRLPTTLLVGGSIAFGLVSLAYYKGHNWLFGPKHINDPANGDNRHEKDHVKRSESAPACMADQCSSKYNLSPMTIQLVYDTENSFFAGIGEKVSLTTGQLNVLKTSSSVLLSPEYDIDEINCLYDMLVLLRQREYLKPGYYKMNILHVLNTARLHVTWELGKYLDQFEETINGILEGEVEKEDNQYDAVIMYTDDDRTVAIRVVEDLKENLVQIPDLRVVLHEELGINTSQFRGMEDILDKCNNIFVIVTAELKKDDLQRYLVEIGLAQCLENPELHLKWRVVPIWMDKQSKESEHCPCELSPLKGVSYWLYLDEASDKNKKLLFGHFQRIILNARQKRKFTRVHSMA